MVHDGEFESKEFQVPCPTCGPRCTSAVVRLYRNGHEVVNHDGSPTNFASHEEAAYVARNKHVYFPGSVRNLTDDQLREVIGRMTWLDRGKALLHR